MNTDTSEWSWESGISTPVPMERLQSGARYRIVIADC
jgi:hypothetical protein